MNKTFPDFENPPVFEVVCGIQFVPLRSLSVPFIGLLWNRFKSDYPKSREAAPLFPVIEQFNEPTRGDDSSIVQNEFPPPRVWFETADGTGLIQVQRDRFLHNWKKEKESHTYPHYDYVIGKFRKSLAVFEEFLKENQLGTIDPTQYELTYINHIFKGEGWETLDDVGDIFRDFSRGKGERFLPSAETINWQTTFLLPDHAGRLRVSMRSGIRKTDGTPAILVEITARGMSSDQGRSAMWSWFDMAHEWIVCGFADLTAENIQKKVWRRTR